MDHAGDDFVGDRVGALVDGARALRHAGARVEARALRERMHVARAQADAVDVFEILARDVNVVHLGVHPADVHLDRADASADVGAQLQAVALVGGGIDTRGLIDRREDFEVLVAEEVVALHALEAGGRGVELEAVELIGGAEGRHEGVVVVGAAVRVAVEDAVDDGDDVKGPRRIGHADAPGAVARTFEFFTGGVRDLVHLGRVLQVDLRAVHDGGLVGDRVVETAEAARHEVLGADHVVAPGVAEGGGYTIAPQYLVKQIIKDLDYAVQIRKRANIIPATNGYASIGIPTLDSDLNNLEWTAEIAAVTEDTNMAFGKREMKANQLTKLVKISKRLIKQSNIDIQSFVQERIAYKLAATLEHNYLYGNGTDKPLGIFAQTSDNTAAIPTDRDIKVGTATAAITYDGLVDAVSG